MSENRQADTSSGVALTGDTLERLWWVPLFGLTTLAILHVGASTDLGSSVSSRGALSSAITILSAAVLGGLFGSPLRGTATVLRGQEDQARALERVESRIKADLARLSETLESLRASGPSTTSSATLKAEQLAEIRRATRVGAWEEARALVLAFQDAHVEDPDSLRAAADLVEARQAAGRELQAKIEAARSVNDPDRVLELRDEAKVLLDAEDMRALDGDLAKWFILLIHRRLRAGTMRPDVAVLAGLVAERFDETPEGASLRASLPTLRRAAGLCARCGQPYRGIDDACPACLGTGSVPLPSPPPVVPAAGALPPRESILSGQSDHLNRSERSPRDEEFLEFPERPA
ncbi:MAG: hypothetical protein NVSMB9_26530 [Isosphaeraceae bacterium]